MRQITMLTEKDDKLSGEVLEGGKYWTVPPFEYSGSDKEAALLERLDIVQIEAQMEADIAAQGEQA